MLGGSLFDGIAGFPLAGQRAGIKFVWASEIESFPISVSKRHFPGMKHLGDITKINGAEIEPVDVITFGSPCQDLSVAGKRAGLDGERSGLFMEAIRIIREMRDVTNGLYPRFIVWENVPGAFSSNGGYDFQAVISEISESEIPMPGSGGWAPSGMVRGRKADIAWRQLDAQHWGVPQRRKRIFLVADFRGRSAGEVLFKSEGLSGDSETGGGEREGTAGGVAVGVGESGELRTEYLTGWDNQEKRIFTDRGVAPTLAGSDGGGGRTGVGYLAQAVYAGFKPRNSAKAGIGYEVEKSLTLTIDDNYAVVHLDVTCTLCASGAGMSRPAGMASETDLVVAIPIHDKATRYKGGGETRNNDGAGNGLGIGKPGDPMPTMTAGDRHAVAAIDCRNLYENEELSATIQSKGGGGFSLNYINPIRVPICRGDYSGDANKTNTIKALRILRGEVGEETFSQWGLGIITSFQPQEVLQSRLYGEGVRCETEQNNGMVNYSLPCKEDCSRRSVCYLWQAGCAGCPPQRWRPHEQLTRELTAYLSQLSQSPTQKTEILYCLWEASEGIRILQQALYPLQKIWKPINMQRYRVRRLLPIECERLMGFPDGYTAGGSDTSRYKALGNSVAIPCVEYIMAGIAECLRGRKL